MSSKLFGTGKNEQNIKVQERHAQNISSGKE